MKLNIKKSSFLCSLSPPQVTTGELLPVASALSLPPIPTPPSLTPPDSAMLLALKTTPAPCLDVVSMVSTSTGQSQSSSPGTTGTFVCQVRHKNLEHFNFNHPKPFTLNK